MPKKLQVRDCNLQAAGGTEAFYCELSTTRKKMSLHYPLLTNFGASWQQESMSALSSSSPAMKQEEKNQNP